MSSFRITWWGSLLLLLFIVQANAIDKATLRWMHNRPPITEIVIEGNQQIKTSKIKEQMYSLERSLFRRLKGERRISVQRETLRRDTLEIKYLYLKNGFLNVRISERFEMNRVDSSAIVRVTIEEGKQYTFGEKHFVGSYPKGYDFHFNKMIKDLKEGKPLDPFRLNETAFDMKTYMANHGYPYARIKLEIDSINCYGACPITFHIESDSLVRFGEISISGADAYDTSFARRELKVNEGSIYRRDDILDSQRRLHESGYYTSFTFNQSQDSTDRLNPEFTLRVRERKPHYVTASTGPVGQSEVKDLLWSIKFGAGTRKLWKLRTQFSADYFFSVGSDSRLRRHLYGLKTTYPWLLGLRMPLTLGLEWHPKIKSESIEEYDIETWSLSLSTRRNFGQKVRTELGLESEWVDIDGIPDSLIDDIKQRDTASVRRKIYFSYRRDSRDHLFIPRRGAVGDFSIQYVGGFLGGDDNFTKIEAGWSTYDVVWPGWIAATRFRVGWVDRFGASELVPAEDRLYLGGASTVRGFIEKSLGPTDDEGDGIGAKYLGLFNLEFRWKTVQVLQSLPGIGKLFRNLPLWQSVFLDAGNVWERFDDIGSENLALGYGTGVQIVSPAGPIRVDYARKIKTDREDLSGIDYRWHFTILYAF